MPEYQNGITALARLSAQGRSELAETIRHFKGEVAAEVTEAFLERHPDWVERYGERARVLGIEDAGYHLEFLAGAIEIGQPATFSDYGRWAAGMLQARQINPRFVAENIEQVGAAVARRLDADRLAIVRLFTEAGRRGSLAARADGVAGETPTDLGLVRRLLLQALLAGQRKGATTIALGALHAGHPVEDLYVEVFQGALYEIGRLWESNAITVAEEHMCAAIMQYVLAQVYLELPLVQTRRGRAVITGVQGELHQLGATMVADLLEQDGWDVRFLGTNMPHEGILKAIQEHDPDVLGISATMVFNVPQVVRLVKEVRERFPGRRPRIVLGGGAFRFAPQAWEEIGADGFAPDLRAALALTRQWSDPPSGAPRSTAA